MLLTKLFLTYTFFLFHHKTATGIIIDIIDDLFLKEEYDFIVVGSGSGGSALANRLSENPNWTVLLLEAGDEPVFALDIPFAYSAAQFTPYNWGYLMEKQEGVCLGMVDQRCPWPRGKGVGGTTLINAMIYTRGSPLDYDRWAALGNPGWSYEDVLPYFLKSEDCRIPNVDERYHQQGGYLTVSAVDERTGSVGVFLEAANQTGYKVLDDYHGEEHMGFAYVQATTRDGERCSVEKAFLRPVRDRENLKISSGSRVTKVLIDAESKNATGVEFVSNLITYTVRAKKEVILAAGAFSSPHLLMLSGVGPKEHLEEFGIEVIQDAPVGQKMYDHNAYFGLVVTVEEPITVQIDLVNSTASILRYAFNRTGPLTMIAAVEALGYIKTNVSDEEVDIPDMELIFMSLSLHTDFGLISRHDYRYTDEVYDKFWGPLEGRHALTIIPMLLQPKSYGYIKLQSDSIFDHPLLYGEFLTDPENRDMKTFIAAVRETQKIVAAPAFQAVGGKMWDLPVPGCEDLEFDTDEYWECAMRQLVTTLHHQTTTCKMGPADDVEAVVDNNLKVYGVNGLRVADTSVIPFAIGAHSNAPSVMVGEKAADIIKNYWLDLE